jgi:hypothetical protein
MNGNTRQKKRKKMSKVVLVASGFSAQQIHDYDYKANGWTIVAINNGWQVCPDLWDWWVKPGDFKGKKPEKTLEHQSIVPRYRNQLNEFGGQRECGYSITLNAAYWTLAELEPTVIGFLGADMNYTPNEEGHTHIYGLGYDIEKNKISDPDRMVERYGKDDPNYLENIYMRLARKAKERDCKVYNLSQKIETRLPYERRSPTKI